MNAKDARAAADKARGFVEYPEAMAAIRAAAKEGLTYHKFSQQLSSADIKELASEGYTIVGYVGKEISW